MESDEKIMNLRPRHENKELSRTFRFKATSQAERIAESVALNTGVNFPKSQMHPNDVDTMKIRAKDNKRTEQKAMQNSTNHFGSLMTSTHSGIPDSKRASSTSRCMNTSRTMVRNSMSKSRHQSVAPFNKSIYGKIKPEIPKTFFKGAVEYLLAGNKNSLGDRDQSLKKILDDNTVQKRFNEDLRRSKEEDFFNSGMSSMRSSKVIRKPVNVKHGLMQNSRHALSKPRFGDLNDILLKTSINA